jgi:cytochrome P450
MKATAISALRHVPGKDGLPWFGETFQFLQNPRVWCNRAHREHGRVVRASLLLQAGLLVADVDFAERFFLDKDQLLSNERGWSSLLGRFFAGGLLLRDFDVHRLHRRIIQVAFKRDALLGYVDAFAPIMERSVARGHTHAYPWMKQITLEAAAAIFLGLEGADMTRVNQLFVDLMEASMAAFRLNLPGTIYGRGVRSRVELDGWIRSLIPRRRANPGRDMLSLLCSAVTEEGERFSDEDIVSHIVLMLMAAHDTTTSALTNLMLELGRRPELQSRLREQVRAVGPFSAASLPRLDFLTDVFREVLRVYPPVRLIPRRTLREMRIGDHRVPANTQVWLNVEHIHHDPRIWSQPDRFDPDRFSEGRAEHKRHRFAWIPFGAGAHTCIGMQFAEMQVKAVLHALLSRYEWSAASSPMQYLPFTKPKNDLPLTLHRLASAA